MVNAALPSEDITEADLVACLWDRADDAVVFGLEDGSGVIAANALHGTVHLLLVAVVPSAQRQGRGAALLSEIERWAFERLNASEVVAGRSAPFYLWPGVDVRATAALCLFEAAGYRPSGSVLNLTFSSTFRALPPEGVEVVPVLADDEESVAATLAFVGSRFGSDWVAETERALARGACFAARAGGGVIGFCCHSVNRAGWLGPMGTDAERRGGGVGAALLGAVAADLARAGVREVEVAWIGPIGFYAKVAGATVSRVFQVPVKRRA